MFMEKDYQFIESTISICPKCFKRLDSKIILKNNKIFILKNCPEHGKQLELLEEDAKYHLNKRKYDKPGTATKKETDTKLGCPFDCGLCPEHEQHTCNALIEITDCCDLGCPVCYASSGKGKFLDVKTIEKMMDFFQEAEGGKAEILQISGGEPTTHPQILEIIKIAKRKKFRYIMLNTNGLRIARDEKFVKELSKFRGRFEIYLQFDGFSKKTHRHFRGKDISKIKKQAIKNLQKYKIPMTLVSTVQKGINDDELGKIVKFGMKQEYVRGVNLQPVAYFGRIKNVPKDRMTLTGIINRIEKQTDIKKSDIVPLPCNVERVSVCYSYKKGKNFIPLTRNFDVKSYLPLIDNTFAFDADEMLKNKKKLLFSGGVVCDCMKDLLSKTKEIIPREYPLMTDEQKMVWWDNNSFRISISSFVDVFNFDIKSMKKECVHVITPDLKRIPFSAYNMFHRKKYK